MTRRPFEAPSTFALRAGLDSPESVKPVPSEPARQLDPVKCAIAVGLVAFWTAVYWLVPLLWRG